MLARGQAPRPGVPEAAPSEGVDAEDLLVPQHVVDAATPTELVRYVHKVQEARLQVLNTFESRFQDLVTAGRAAEYPPLVERFKPKFGACRTSLERISSALAPYKVVASLVQKVANKEDERLDIQLELQVLEQHLSLLSIDHPDHPELKQKVASKRSALKQCNESIFEALEELRCEAADIET